MLYITATPIGNLKDITQRAIETLKAVDLIAAEDTRHTQKLLKYYNILKPLTSYFEHNKAKKASYIISQIKQGKDVALVSDSGTPGISDPGFYIIREAVKEGVEVTALPGASAAINGLVLSGLPTDRFVFEGFLSHKSAARQKRLKELAKEKRTVVLYESPHRLLKTLADMTQLLPSHKVACCREMTKKFEEVVRGIPSEILQYFTKKRPKGEVTIVIASLRTSEVRGEAISDLS